MSDTVGFVRHLPHQLVEAFRSTLEEVADSDLILHVVDGSHPDPEGQIAAVREVFAEIGADKVPELVVINKADAADPMVIARLRQREPHSVVVSRQDRRGHRRGAARRRGRPAAARASSSRRCCPTSAATCSTGSTSSGEVDVARAHRRRHRCVRGRAHADLAGELAPYLVTAAPPTRLRRGHHPGYEAKSPGVRVEAEPA